MTFQMSSFLFVATVVSMAEIFYDNFSFLSNLIQPFLDDFIGSRRRYILFGSLIVED